MKERIQKVLANAGVASRRNIEEMVLQGRVAVNGKVVKTLPVLVDPDKDEIEVDAETVKLGTPTVSKRLYFLLNKPKGVYSTNVAQGEQRLAIELLPPDLPGRVYPVGRLDAESRGLLLLTNDGELTNQLTHPRYGVSRTYRATADGAVPDEVISELEQGVWLADERKGGGFKTGRCHIKIVRRSQEKTILDLTLKEGRNRQIRRMLAKVGHKVRDLIRIRLGPLTLEGLAPGRFRPLTPKEIRLLKQTGQRGEKPRKHPRAPRREAE